MIKIAKGEYIWIIVPLSLFILSSLLSAVSIMFFISSAFLLIITTFLLMFFRDPERKIPKNKKSIVSPADGIVIKTDSIGKFLRIAIFMSPKNVHVNRSPLKGKVIEIKRFSGSKTPAYKDYAEKNERLVTKLKTKIGHVNVVQITGMFARRIKTYLAKGQEIEKGQRIGIIKFGSRCDVYLPKNRVNLIAKLGDKLYAGESTIAFIK